MTDCMDGERVPILGGGGKYLRKVAKCKEEDCWEKRKK